MTRECTLCQQFSVWEWFSLNCLILSALSVWNPHSIVQKIEQEGFWKHLFQYKCFKMRIVDFVLISSENTFPGYGKDGQAILNEQIGKIQEYELFIGIMWSRIWTPTLRAKSGTTKEFGWAVQAWKHWKKPEVLFYFRLSKVCLPTTAEEARQLGEVAAFRNKFRGEGLFREYENPSDFCDQLRKHWTLYLNQRQEKTQNLGKQHQRVKQNLLQWAIARSRQHHQLRQLQQKRQLQRSPLHHLERSCLQENFYSK